MKKVLAGKGWEAYTVSKKAYDRLYFDDKNAKGNELSREVLSLTGNSRHYLLVLLLSISRAVICKKLTEMDRQYLQQVLYCYKILKP